MARGIKGINVDGENILRDVVHRVLSMSGDGVENSPQGITIAHDKKKDRVEDIAELARVRLISESDDTLSVQRIYGKDSGAIGTLSSESVPTTDVVAHGNAFTVWKPWSLRKTPFNGNIRIEGPNDIEWVYTYSGNQRRTRSSVLQYHTEIVRPTYEVDDQLIICRASQPTFKLTTGSGSSATWVTSWMDINVDARRWVPWMGEVFVVDVDQTSGSAGNATTKCSWTYEVQDIYGNILGTGMTPNVQRPTVGAMLKGDGLVGTGFYESDGDFDLLSAGEVPDPAAC